MDIDINRLTLLGTVEDEPRTRQAGNSTVTSFKLVVLGFEGRESYVRVNCWNDFMRRQADDLRSGDRVYVEGRASASAYEGQDGKAKASLECNAEKIITAAEQQPRSDRREDRRGDDRGSRGSRDGNRDGGSRRDDRDADSRGGRGRYSDEDRQRTRDDRGGSRREEPRRNARDFDDDDGDDPFARE